MVIVLVGGPSHGFTAHGPFDDRKQALMWIHLDSEFDEHACHLMDVTPVVRGYEETEASES
jgi:hypothetical protein